MMPTAKRSLLCLALLPSLLLLQCSRSPEPKAWTPGWKESTPLLKGRTGAVAVAARNHLYVFGGGFGIPGPDTVLREVEKAGIRENGEPGEWKAARPMRTPRIFPAATAFNDVIYIAGGEYFPEGKMLLLGSVEWTRVDENGNLGPWQSGGEMQTPRRWPTIAVADGFLYAMGGYNGTFLRTVERAKILPDGGLGPWEYLPQQLTTKRYIHGGAAVGNRIYVVGGHIQGGGKGMQGAEWSTVEKDGSLAEWKTTSSMLQPRFLAGSAAGGGSIYVVGGYDAGYLDSVESAPVRPDGGLGDWKPLAPLPFPREGPATVYHDKRLYIMGGSNRGTYLPNTAWTEIGKDGTLGHWTPVSN